MEITITKVEANLVNANCILSENVSSGPDYKTINYVSYTMGFRYKDFEKK